MVSPSIGWAALAFERGFPAIALDVHLEDGGVVDEAVDGGERHGLVGENLAPFAEGLVGGDEQGAALVAGADQLEQHAGLGLILGDVGEVVEDQQVIFVELGDGGFEGQFAARDLQPLHEVGGAGEQHAPAIFDEGQAERCRKMALAAAGRAEQEEIGAFSSQLSPAASAMTCALLTIGTASKSKVSSGLAGRQAGFGKMALDAAPAALGDLVLGEGGQEAGGWPALLVGARGELGPDQLDGGQAQLVEQELDAGGVDGVVARSCRDLQAGGRLDDMAAASSS